MNTKYTSPVLMKSRGEGKYESNTHTYECIEYRITKTIALKEMNTAPREHVAKDQTVLGVS